MSTLEPLEHQNQSPIAADRSSSSWFELGLPVLLLTNRSHWPSREAQLVQVWTRYVMVLCLVPSQDARFALGTGHHRYRFPARRPCYWPLGIHPARKTCAARACPRVQDATIVLGILRRAGVDPEEEAVEYDEDTDQEPLSVQDELELTRAAGREVRSEAEACPSAVLCNRPSLHGD